MSNTKDPKNSPLKPLQGMISTQKGEIGNDPNSSKSGQTSPTNPPKAMQNDPVCQLTAELDKLPEKTKVRIIYKDYESYRQFLPLIGKYKSKFTIFKDKKEFIISTDCNKDREKETVNLSELLNSWLEKNQIPEPIKKVLKDEIKS